MVESTPTQLDAVFHALSDATRRAILREVSWKERSVSEIAAPHAMSLAAVSKHLKVLERAELIVRRRQGSFQLVRLEAKNLRLAEEWLAYYETFWRDRLDALQTHLEREEGEDDGDSN